MNASTAFEIVRPLQVPPISDGETELVDYLMDNWPHAPVMKLCLAIEAGKLEFHKGLDAARDAAKKVMES